MLRGLQIKLLRGKPIESGSSDYIRSGASMPNRFNPVPRTRFVAAHKAKRDARTSSSLFMTGQFS